MPAKLLHAPVAVLLLFLGACGSPRAPPAPAAGLPGEPGKPRAAHPRAATPPPAVRKAWPECDPRWLDPDRGRVALGLVVGDCEDERGRNAVYVTRLVPLRGEPSPAQRAGVQAGDKVVRIDSCEIATTHALATQMRHAPPGWVARFQLEREGRALDIFVPTVTLPDRSEPQGPPTLSTAGCRAIGRRPAR